METFVSAIVGLVPQIQGWQVGETAHIGSLVLACADYPEVRVYATPNWNDPDTLAISVEREDSTFVRSAQVPAYWTGTDRDIARLWETTLEKYWTNILQAVIEASEWHGTHITAADLQIPRF